MQLWTDSCYSKRMEAGGPCSFWRTADCGPWKLSWKTVRQWDVPLTTHWDTTRLLGYGPKLNQRLDFLWYRDKQSRVGHTGRFQVLTDCPGPSPMTDMRPLRLNLIPQPAVKQVPRSFDLSSTGWPPAAQKRGWLMEPDRQRLFFFGYFVHLPTAKGHQSSAAMPA